MAIRPDSPASAPALYSDLLERAVRLAARGHHHQFRKQNPAEKAPSTPAALGGNQVPYMTHLAGVMCILARIGADERLLAAALLHDYLEDAPDSDARASVAEAAGDDVLGLVGEVSENKRADRPETETWEIRKAEAIEHITLMSTDGALLKAADLLHNLHSLAYDLDAADEAATIWARFNAGPERQLWYSRSLLEALSRRLGPNHVLVRDLAATVDRIAGHVPE